MQRLNLVKIQRLRDYGILIHKWDIYITTHPQVTGIIAESGEEGL